MKNKIKNERETERETEPRKLTSPHDGTFNSFVSMNDNYVTGKGRFGSGCQGNEESFSFRQRVYHVI